MTSFHLMLFGGYVPFSLAFGAEVETLFIQGYAVPIVESGSALCVQQDCVAMSGLQGGEELDAVAEARRHLLSDVIRRESTVKLIQDSQPIVVKRKIRRDFKRLCYRQQWYRARVELFLDTPSVRETDFDAKAQCTWHTAVHLKWYLRGACVGRSRAGTTARRRYEK